MIDFRALAWLVIRDRAVRFLAACAVVALAVALAVAGAGCGDVDDFDDAPGASCVVFCDGSSSGTPTQSEIRDPAAAKGACEADRGLPAARCAREAFCYCFAQDGGVP